MGSICCTIREDFKNTQFSSTDFLSSKSRVHLKPPSSRSNSKFENKSVRALREYIKNNDYSNIQLESNTGSSIQSFSAPSQKPRLDNRVFRSTNNRSRDLAIDPNMQNQFDSFSSSHPSTIQYNEQNNGIKNLKKELDLFNGMHDQRYDQGAPSHKKNKDNNRKGRHPKATAHNQASVNIFKVAAKVY